jgi:putative ABC transport system permease protein
LSVVAGIIAGLIGAIAGTRLISSLLYGVEPTDVPTFVLTTIALAGVALVACTAPAVKAAFVDPVVALRAE